MSLKTQIYDRILGLNGKRNSLSSSLARYESAYWEKVNHRYVVNTKNTLYEVQGAGFISISELPHARTGSAKGYIFDVEWGKYGFIGGVLDKQQAKLLAEHILNNIDK